MHMHLRIPPHDGWWMQINVKDGDFSGLSGLEPALTWQGTSRYGSTDLDYGIDVAARTTTDLGTLPRRVWGRARQRVADWDLAARADVDSQGPWGGDVAQVVVTAERPDLDLALRAEGAAGLAGRPSDLALHRVQATKGMQNEEGHRLILTPRYDLRSRAADIVLAWRTGEVDVEVTASAAAQRVKLSKRLDDDNWVSPTIDSRGDVSLEWEHRIDDESSFTARIKPQEAVDVRWTDKEWTASVNMPVDGRDVSGANVHISREVKF